MTQHMTNGQLSAILSDIDLWMNNSPAFAIFTGPKVKRFREQNRPRIESLQKGFTKLLDDHVEMVDGKPTMQELDGKQKFKFKSPEDEEAYGEEYKVLMEKGFDVYL